MKTWYQIDKRQANTELIEYKMIKANNRHLALRQYLGKTVNFINVNQRANADDYIVTEGFKNGKFVLSARTLGDKSFYIEVTRITQQ
jgi:hypothetical protein